jgi:hypothetical protein
MPSLSERSTRAGRPEDQPIEVAMLALKKSKQKRFAQTIARADVATEAAVRCIAFLHDVAEHHPSAELQP